MLTSAPHRARGGLDLPSRRNGPRETALPALDFADIAEQTIAPGWPCGATRRFKGRPVVTRVRLRDGDLWENPARSAYTRSTAFR